MDSSLTATLPVPATGSAAFARQEIAKLQQSLEVLAEPRYLDLLAAIAERVVASLRGEGRIFFCGNGGSAADAQHLAAELTAKGWGMQPEQRAVERAGHHALLGAGARR